MAEELDWIYYDSVSSGTTASATLKFFAQDEQTSNKQTTNMPVKNRLLSTEELVIHEIIAYPESDTEHADLVKLYDKAILEFKIQNNRVILAPLIMFAPKTMIHSTAPILNQAALVSIAGVTGGPFMLKNPITIPRGASFSVDIKIGEGTSPTASDLKVGLRGILKRQ